VGLSFAAVVPGGGTSVLPIPLNVQRLAGRIVLSWTNPAFVLQSAPAVTGPYNTVPSVNSPYTNLRQRISEVLSIESELDQKNFGRGALAHLHRS